MDGDGLRGLQGQLVADGLDSSYESAGRKLDLVVRDTILRRGQKWVDVPCRSSDEDAFGFRVLARELARSILHPHFETPYTLCIDGQWGTGKSSLARLLQLEILRDEVLSQGCLPVWIDTSLMGSLEGVLEVLGTQTLEAASLLAKRIAADPDKPGDVEDHVQPLMPATYGLDDRDTREITVTLKRLRLDAQEWLNQWSANEPLEWQLDLLRQLIHSIRYGLLGRGGLAKVVYFIDDLDRCKQDVITKVLEVHRTFLEQWGLILVYPMNVRVIESVVDREFLEQGSVGQPYHPDPQAGIFLHQAATYLEKMFFNRIRPPEPSLENIDEWLRFLLPDDAWFLGLTDFMRDAYFANPRYIKRFASHVGSLVERLTTAPGGGMWDGLLGLGDSVLATQIITKVAAFAFAESLKPFYEPARKPDPRQLITSELSALEGGLLPCIAFNREQGVWEEVLEPGPRVLSEFLRTGPRLSTHVEAAQSAFQAVETILPTSHYRWRRPSQLETLDTDRRSSTEKGESASTAERERVQEVVSQWLAKMEESVQIPDRIRSIIGTAVPSIAVEAFRDADWEPSVPDIVTKALTPLNAGAELEASWLLSVAALHENWAFADLQATNSILRATNREDLRLDFARLGLSRLRGSREAQLECFSIFADNGSLEVQNEALDGLLAILGIDQEALDSTSIQLTNSFDDQIQRQSLLRALDVLRALDREKAALALVEAALATPTGRQESSIVRNLAVVIEKNEDKNQMAQSVYDAALVMNPKEEMAALWCGRTLTNLEEQALYYLTSVDRDPTDADYWFEVGVLYHNSGNRDHATAWLEQAVALSPKKREFREGLRRNLSLTRGLSEAEKVRDEDFIPKVDESELRQAAREAHDELLRRIVSTGEVRYCDTVLFDPEAIPQWLTERLPDLG